MAVGNGGSRKIKLNTGKGRKPKQYGLTDRQQLFVREYCVDLNASAACVRAGLSKKAAPMLMQEVAVINAIRLQLGKRAKETEIDAERVLCELALIAFSNPQDMFNKSTGCMLHITEMPEEVARSIASLDVVSKTGEDGEITTVVKVRFWNKLEALTSIGKHLGILGAGEVQQHLHLHSAATNPFINADPSLILEAKEAMTKLEHSVKGNIDDE